MPSAGLGPRPQLLDPSAFALPTQIFPCPSTLPTLCAELLRYDHPSRPNLLDILLLLPLRHFLVLSRLPTNESTSGQAAIGLSLVTFLGIKKNILVPACCGHLPLCSTFPKNSTISPLMFLLSSPKDLSGWKPSHPPPMFAWYNLDDFSKIAFF